MIDAQVVCDSVGEHSPCLTTFLVRFPAFVEQELLRHRSFSFSSSSSRAIPVAKMLAEVRDEATRAAPVWWGREQKGMASGDELSDEPNPGGYVYSSDRAYAKLLWMDAALDAVKNADRLAAHGVHKSIVNRVLGPYVHRRIVVTSCEPGLMNFFGLRLDKAAQPEIRVLAEAMWKMWNESETKKLVPGEWHLPFIDDETSDLIICACIAEHARTGETPDPWVLSTKISAARCARTSYLSFDTGKRSTIEEDLALADRLIAQGHWSPLEHQATPDIIVGKKLVLKTHGQIICDPITGFPIINSEDLLWKGQLEEVDAFQFDSQSGNLGPGWRQFRKMYPGESVAPLPEEYR
jgi:thymidylate synthase ThyX